MAIRGSLNEASLPDVLQLLAMGNKTGTLTLVVPNSGGTIFDTDRYRKGGFQPERAMANVRRVGDRMREVFAIADRDGLAYHRAADRLAEQRIAALNDVRLLDTAHR